MKKKAFLKMMLLLCSTALPILASASSPSESHGRELKSPMSSSPSMRHYEGAKKPTLPSARQNQDQQNDALNTIVDENFSLWTAGTETEPIYGGDVSGFYSDPADLFMINDTFTAQPGWGGEGICLAGGACGLTYPDYGGYIQTPQGDYSGHMTLTFRARTAENNETESPSLVAGLLKGYFSNGVQVQDVGIKNFKIDPDGTWHEYTWECDVKYGGDDAFIQFNTYDYIILDDIRIVTETTSLPNPLLKAATDYTYNGFTANWQSVAKATDYLLTCFRRIPVSNEEYIDIDEDFDNLNVNDGKIDSDNNGLAAGWEFNLNNIDDDSNVYTGEGNVQSGKYSIKLDRNGDMLTTPDNGGLITEFSFSLKYVDGKIEIPEYDYIEYPGMLTLQGWDGYNWTNIVYWFFSENDEDFNIKNPGDDVAGKYYRLRLVTSQFEDYKDFYETTSAIAIDKIHIRTLPATKREYVCENIPVEGTSYVFDNLDSESDYYYYVRSRNTILGIESGAPEAEQSAFGVASPAWLKTTDVDSRGAFTANWDNVPKASSYLVNCYDVFTAPEEIQSYEVLYEDFSRIKTSATPENPIAANNVSLLELNDLTSNIGWYGFLYGIADGALGGVGLSEYGYGGQIQTPELSLGNNDGVFHVTLTVCGTTGDFLDVISRSGTGVAFPLTEQYTTMEADFHSGQMFDVLAFLTENKTPFFISDIKIEQSISKGDKVYTLIEEPITENNSYRFSGLERGDNKSWAYEVLSMYRKYSDTTFSRRSELEHVSIETGVIQNICDNNPVISIIANGGKLVVSTDRVCEVKVYDLAGICLLDEAACVGNNMYDLNRKGVYIVMAGGKTAKINVR